MKNSNKGVIIVKEKKNELNPDVSITKYTSKIPYSYALRLFFIILQLTLSYDLGFLKCKSRKGLAIKILSFCTASIVTITLEFYSVTDLDMSNYNTWLFLLYARYLFVVIRLFLNSENNSFSTFLERLSAFDYEMNTRMKYSDFQIIGSCISVAIFKIFVVTMHCTYYVPKDCIERFCLIHSVVIYVVGPSLDFFFVLYCLSFYLVLCRLKNLKDIVNDSDEPIRGHVFYKSLLEIIDSCRSCFDVLYICCLLFKVPDALVTTFLIIKHNKFNGEGGYSSIVYSNWVFQYLIIVIVPAVIASRFALEVDKIKIILHDKLLLEDITGSKALAIRNFLLYIEARPMRFYICSVILLDSSFPFLVLNLFVTYLIVAVQFSHIY